MVFAAAESLSGLSFDAFFMPKTDFFVTDEINKYSRNRIKESKSSRNKPATAFLGCHFKQQPEKNERKEVNKNHRTVSCGALRAQLATFGERRNNVSAPAVKV